MKPLRLLAAILICALAGSSNAVFLGMVDDFEDGTTMGWGGGNPANQPTGGPLGTDDNFIQCYQGAPLGNQHLACKNEVQWTGDYSGQGIIVLEADMKNFSTIPLELRVVMFGTSTTRITSTSYYTLPNDSAWHKVAFPIRAADFTRVLNYGESIGQVLANNQRLMIRYDPGSPSAYGSNPPEGILETSFGLDNIRASAFASCFTTVEPNFVRGIQLGGNLASLQSSDDDKLIGRPGPVLVATLAPLLIELKSQATLTNFSALRFRIESSSSSTIVVQKVFLYDYVTPGFVELDSRFMTNADNVIEVAVTSNATRYRSTTGEMKAQISYKANGPVLVFPWQARIDFAVWTLFP